MSQKRMELATLAFVLEDTYSPRKSKNKTSVGVTLCVRGVLITGRMISEKEFLRHPQNTELGDFLDQFESSEVRKKHKASEDYDVVDDIAFICLKNAFYVQGDKRTPAGNEGAFIRVALDSIDAYTMSELPVTDV